jgi:Mrp family chromosome partitioning ATPase
MGASVNSLARGPSGPPEARDLKPCYQSGRSEAPPSSAGDHHPGTMHVVVVASQKGGVGKTTIALNLGLALARAGARTLLTEFDAQGSLGLSLGLSDRAKPGIAEILTGAETFDRVLQRTRENGLGLLSVGRVDPTTVAGFEDALTRPGAIASACSTPRAATPSTSCSSTAPPASER